MFLGKLRLPGHLRGSRVSLRGQQALGRARPSTEEIGRITLTDEEAKILKEEIESLRRDVTSGGDVEASIRNRLESLMKREPKLALALSFMLGFNGGVLAGIIDNQRDILKRLEMLERKVSKGGIELEIPLEKNEERYMEYLKDRQITDEPLSELKLKASRRALAKSLGVGIGISIFPIATSIAIGTALGNPFMGLSAAAFLSVFTSMFGGFLALASKDDFDKKELDVELNRHRLSPAEALRHLKAGHPVYLDGEKVTSMKELKLLKGESSR